MCNQSCRFSCQPLRGLALQWVGVLFSLSFSDGEGTGMPRQISATGPNSWPSQIDGLKVKPRPSWFLIPAKLKILKLSARAEWALLTVSDKWLTSWFRKKVFSNVMLKNFSVSVQRWIWIPSWVEKKGPRREKIVISFFTFTETSCEGLRSGNRINLR